MDVAIRHPVFLTSNKLVRAPKGVTICHHQWSSPVAEGYVYFDDWMNWEGVKRLPSPRPASADLDSDATFANVATWFLIVILIAIAICCAQFRQPRAVPTPWLWILLKFVRMVSFIAIVYFTKGSPTKPVRQDRSCSPDHNDTKASVVEKVPTILKRRTRFVVVKTASGKRHLSVTDWMMWKDKDAKWLSDSKSENKGTSEGVSCAEESISDDGIAREEMEGQSSSIPEEKTPYSEPPLLLGSFA